MNAQLTHLRAQEHTADLHREAVGVGRSLSFASRGATGVLRARVVGVLATNRHHGQALIFRRGTMVRARATIWIAITVATAAALALFAPGVAAAEPPPMSSSTAISDPVVPSGPAYVGAAVTVSATLSGFAGGGVAGETVDFAITDPSGGVTDVSSAPTDDNGVASATFTPTQKGVYDVVASFAGDASDASSTSTAVSTSVYQKVQLSVPSVNAVAGVGTAVSATLLTVPGGKPVPDEQVEISPGGSQPPRSVFTDANGVASSKVTYATSGSFTAQAQFSDAADFFANSDGSLEPAEVASGPVDVSPDATSISSFAVSAGRPSSAKQPSICS